MIGTTKAIQTAFDAMTEFQSPISGVNDWNIKVFGGGEWEKQFQSPISGVNDWNLVYFFHRPPRYTLFQSPISGVNDWNMLLEQIPLRNTRCFSLLLAELMIGTKFRSDTKRPL